MKCFNCIALPLAAFFALPILALPIHAQSPAVLLPVSQQLTSSASSASSSSSISDINETEPVERPSASIQSGAVPTRTPDRFGVATQVGIKLHRRRSGDETRTALQPAARRTALRLYRFISGGRRRRERHSAPRRRQDIARLVSIPQWSPRQPNAGLSQPDRRTRHGDRSSGTDDLAR